MPNAIRGERRPGRATRRHPKRSVNKEFKCCCALIWRAECRSVQTDESVASRAALNSRREGGHSLRYLLSAARIFLPREDERHTDRPPLTFVNGKLRIFRALTAEITLRLSANALCPSRPPTSRRAGEHDKHMLMLPTAAVAACAHSSRGRVRHHVSSEISACDSRHSAKRLLIFYDYIRAERAPPTNVNTRRGMRWA